MLRRLELNGHSMISRMAQLEVVTNNLANISTSGFKRDNVFVNALKEKLTFYEEGGERIESHYPTSSLSGDFTQGNLVETNRPLDVAISGEGFFIVETPQGEAYTRNGKFTMNAGNILTTFDGQIVLGEGGPIEIDNQQKSPNEILINESGEIYLDGNLIDKLQIVAPEDPQKLMKKGANLFQFANASSGMQPVESASVKQGFIEDSNVNPVVEMIRMMEILQQFEMEQKVIRTQDDLLGQAADQIGRLR